MLPLCPGRYHAICSSAFFTAFQPFPGSPTLNLACLFERGLYSLPPFHPPHELIASKRHAPTQDVLHPPHLSCSKIAITWRNCSSDSRNKCDYPPFCNSTDLVLRDCRRTQCSRSTPAAQSKTIISFNKDPIPKCSPLDKKKSGH